MRRLIASLLAAALAVALALLLPHRVVAQKTPNPAGMNENRLHRDFRVEATALGACTRFASLADCGQTLVMGQPMHIALGSLAPQNGFAAGLAFVEHKNFSNEVRTSYDIDAVASPSGSWRAGGYMKLFRQPGGFTYRPAPLVDLYAQTISLRRVDYYGLGPDASALNHSTFGFREQIYGANLTLPTSGTLHTMGVILLGELDDRIPVVHPGSDSTLPSINLLFDESTAPGLTRQPATLQAAAGIRLVPSMPRAPFTLNYLARFDQFVAPGNSASSFRRFVVDLDHQIPLYNLLPTRLRGAYYKASPPAIQYQGPDDCTATSASRNINPQRAATADAHSNPAQPCPIVSTTRQLEGSIELRGLLSESFAGSGSAVPFYFTPTLGGSDVNGTAALASYPDYRFRGPSLILLRGTVEHSIGKLPLGAIFSVDSGKVALARGDIDLDHLRHTFSAGVTVHAGGLPVFSIEFAWGGNEGNHTTTTISPALLGGSSRPSLF